VTRLERRWCRALLEACLPGEGGLESVDLALFWPRFDAVAPLHLRLGLRLATWVLCFGPLLMLRRPLARLAPPARDEALRRMARWPGIGELVEVARIVACFALFDDDAVQAQVRGR